MAKGPCLSRNASAIDICNNVKLSKVAGKQKWFVYHKFQFFEGKVIFDGASVDYKIPSA